MTRFSRTLMVLCMMLAGHISTGWAAELASANGPVVLTVVGEIEHTNRPAFSEFEDAFTNYHEKTFDKAAEFDLAMLEALGMHEVEVNYQDWPKTLRFAGPYLKDVLDTVGAKPESLTALALDGFASELSGEDLDKEAWIVAVMLDGKYMKIGQRGPIWIIFDPGEDKSITPEEEMTWPWATFFMELR